MYLIIIAKKIKIKYLKKIIHIIIIKNKIYFKITNNLKKNFHKINN